MLDLSLFVGWFSWGFLLHGLCNDNHQDIKGPMTHDDQPTLSSNRWNDLKTLPSPNMFKI